MYRQPEPFLEAVKAGRLVLPFCDDCSQYHWYPMPRCPHCSSDQIAWRDVKDVARLFTWTVVRHAFAPELADKVPFVLALVEPTEAPGVRLVTNIYDCDPSDLHIGALLRADFRCPVWSDTPYPVFCIDQTEMHPRDIPLESSIKEQQ